MDPRFAQPQIFLNGAKMTRWLVSRAGKIDITGVGFAASRAMARSAGGYYMETSPKSRQ